jgi:hypothetical protein
MRRFLRPSLRRPFPVFFVPTQPSQTVPCFDAHLARLQRALHPPARSTYLYRVSRLDTSDPHHGANDSPLSLTPTAGFPPIWWLRKHLAPPILKSRPRRWAQQTFGRVIAFVAALDGRLVTCGHAAGHARQAKIPADNLPAIELADSLAASKGQEVRAVGLSLWPE